MYKRMKRLTVTEVIHQLKNIPYTFQKKQQQSTTQSLIPLSYLLSLLPLFSLSSPSLFSISLIHLSSLLSLLPLFSLSSLSLLPLSSQSLLSIFLLFSLFSPFSYPSSPSSLLSS